MILKCKDRLCGCCLVVFVYCGLLLGWNVINYLYLRDINYIIISTMKINYITININNIYKLFLFECYFIKNLFKNKNLLLLQKCKNFLFYIYFRIVIFMYFSFNKIFSKLIFSYLIILYLYISLFFIYKIIYLNICITDNFLLFNNILLENYSIFDDIKFDINNNQELNKDFNVLYFDNNNKSLIPYNNGNNNMNNMNNMNNNEILNKDKNNKNEEYDTETISLIKKLKDLKQSNSHIFDMIKKHYSDNNNTSLDKSLALV